VVSKSSISRVQSPQKTGRLLRPALLILLCFSLAMAAIAVWTFIEADRLMRDEPEPLPVFNSNVMPGFTPVSFRSLDEQTTLHGWFMQAEQPISTIILIHDVDRNRLQFGLETPLLYRHLVSLGYNVLSFDLRNTGQSGGHLSAYGYSEWADVIAAIRYVRLYATTQDVLLYGFGTGASAALIAWDQLPVSDEDRENKSKPIQELTFDRSYVKGILLDSPASSPDDPIGARYRDRHSLAQRILSTTVPYAVRLSSGSIRHLSHITVLGSCHIPVFIAAHTEDTVIGQASAETVLRERELSHPDLTTVFTSETAGYIDGFDLDQEKYLDAVTRFLTRFFQASSPG